jgi:hypothetical protein
MKNRIGAAALYLFALPCFLFSQEFSLTLPEWLYGVWISGESSQDKVNVFDATEKAVYLYEWDYSYYRPAAWDYQSAYKNAAQQTGPAEYSLSVTDGGVSYTETFKKIDSKTLTHHYLETDDQGVKYEYTQKLYKDGGSYMPLDGAFEGFFFYDLDWTGERKPDGIFALLTFTADKKSGKISGTAVIGEGEESLKLVLEGEFRTAPLNVFDFSLFSGEGLLAVGYARLDDAEGRLLTGFWQDSGTTGILFLLRN